MPDELLDVVNDQDVVTAQVLRSLVHEQGLQHRGVHVFLFTREGKLLVQQRSRNKDSHPLAWDCSVSEHVKAGESYDQAAERGLLEELGLREIEIQPLVKFKMLYGQNDYEISRLYHGSVDPAFVRFDPAEIEQAAYYRITDLLEMIPADENKFSYWFIQLLAWYAGHSSDMEIMQVDSDLRPFL